MKVLLSAYSCLPDTGSEPGIGWNWAQEIAAYGHQVFVVTRAINRKTIEAACERDSIRNPEFVFHDLSALTQRLYQLPLGNYAYYVLWQYSAANLALQIHGEERFEQVQHITWGTFRLPSFMGKLGIPFIFGPVAGGEDTPKNFRSGLGVRGRIWDWARRISNALLTRVPLMSATYLHATQIVATTNETLREIPTPYRRKVRVQQAVGIDTGRLRCTSEVTNSVKTSSKRYAKLKLLFVGRLLPWKGVHIGLKMLARLGPLTKDVHLTVVGSGSDEARLKRLARKLGVADFVSWIPWMKREDLIQLYSEFDLFLFPSLHDSGGMAVLEAMSLGLPVLCLDLGGPGVSVDNTCGRVIKTADRTEAELVRVMASCVSQLFRDRATLEVLAEGARRRVELFSWEAAISSTYARTPRLQVDL